MSVPRRGSGRLRFIPLAFVGLGLGVNAAFFLALSAGGWSWQNDFAAYYLAAERLLDGVSPYAAVQLAGAYAAVDPDLYLYPPPFAQVLGPLTFVPLEAAKVIWLLVCFGAAWAAAWVAAGIGGTPRGFERTSWTLAATLLFPPVVLAAWQGNVGTILSLTATLVAVGGATAGVAAAVGTLVKVVPGGLIPAALVHSRRSAIALLGTLLIAVVVSAVLAWSAWLDYPAVLVNMLAGGVNHSRNLAPHEVVGRLGATEPLVSLARGVAVAVGIAAIAASMWTARRPFGMPVAALLGTVAMLIVPGTLWYHYLAVVLPFAVMSWARASASQRGIVLAGAVAMSAGLVVGGGTLTLLGAAAMLGVAAAVLWATMAAGRTGGTREHLA